jgi:hypothetical protein
MENEVYNPKTERVVNGQVVRDPFMGCDGETMNVICTDSASPNYDQLDSVALKIQALDPKPTNSSLTNNLYPNQLIPNAKTVPALKIDHYFSPRIKLSGYWSLSTIIARKQMNDGLDWPGTMSYGNPERAHTFRLNYDQTLTPTLLLHIGAGFMHALWAQSQSSFDPASIGLKGTYVNCFPTLLGLSNSFGGHLGLANSSSMGANQLYELYEEKPTGTPA